MNQIDFTSSGGKKVFAMLKASPVYNNIPELETEKERIVGEVWGGVMIKFIHEQYYPAGLEIIPAYRSLSNKQEIINGFGFFVEEFAERTYVISRNTEEARKIDWALRSTLHNADHSYAVFVPMPHPDIICIDLSPDMGRITAIVEVKSSASGFEYKPEQLERSEESVTFLVQRIEQMRMKNVLNDVFTHHKLEVAEDLQKILLLPKGERNKIASEWPEIQIREMEFTAEEIKFMARLIWPEFTG